MTRTFERQEFGDFHDRDSGRVFEGFEFRRCRFTGSALSITLDPRLRSTVRDVRLTNCEVAGCTLWSAVVEEATVDGLKTSGLLQTWAAVFRHVTLKGKVGRVMFSRSVWVGVATPGQQRAFDEANDAFYAAVDWALDIREADFAECELQGVPADLIRRDPANHFVVRREKAMEGRWRGLDLSGTHWATSIELFLARGDADVLLVAPKRHANYRRLLDGLNALRDAGVAEPD